MNEQQIMQHILQMLDLENISTNEKNSVFQGESMYFPTGRVYGGQVIAQSIIAASNTVSPSRLPNSIHGYFITPGKIDEKVSFNIETLKDGRSFSSRRINAEQSHSPILTAIASFQEIGQGGFEFADPMPVNIPKPEDLPSLQQLTKPFENASPFADYYANHSPFDIRHISPNMMLNPHPTPQENGHQMVWMRTASPIENQPQIKHRALLALGCDQLMLEPMLRRAGIPLTTPGLSYASLDHSMWWYRNINMSQWHLYVQDTTTAAHGRGLSHAKVYAQDGTLVAAIAQEAMIRVPQYQ
ncbi:MAG: thioesterase family protein [Bifidobacteriaceae bacterium]|nr:thioesterase family protein [Bifidobacteriaceae bacterium]